MEEKVLIDDLESSEDNMFVDVRYNGELFSGIAYDFRENFHSEYNYKNGLGHGRCFSVYNSGQLYEEFFLENGEKLEETCWYETGVKEEYYKKNPYLKQYWNEESILLLEENDECIKYWYPSTKLKSVFIKKKVFFYYSENGEWVIKIKVKNDFSINYGLGDIYTVKNNTLLDKREILFNEAYIVKHYIELLQDYDFYSYFIIWLTDVEKTKLKEIICNMIKNDILWHKIYGMELAVKYQIHEAVPFIKLEIDNYEKQANIVNIRGTGTCVFCLTISQTAKDALEKFEKMY